MYGSRNVCVLTLAFLMARLTGMVRRMRLGLVGKASTQQARARGWPEAAAEVDLHWGGRVPQKSREHISHVLARP